MKRVDEARVIKISETAAAPAASAPPPVGTQVIAAAATPSTVGGATPATIFPNRPLEIPISMMSTIQTANTPAAAAAAAAAAATVGPPPPQVTAANFTRVMAPAAATTPVTVSTAGSTAVAAPNAPSGGVSVYRDGGVAITAVATPAPPAAHSANNPPGLVTQPLSNIKPEPITLPNIPVSVQYAAPAAAAALPPNLTTVKSLQVTQAGSAQSIVQNLQQQQQNQAHHQQVLHQNKVTYGPPAIRTITAANLPTVPNAAATAAAAAAAQQQQQQAHQPPPPPPPTGANAVAPTPQPPPATPTGSGGVPRLRVEDALSYLDQVKYKFENQPQIYNDFLDIMKEFKSQSIDTPGVIARVSCLFRGHQELIVGFNTFLPPGYRIEVQCNESVAVSMPGVIGAGMQTIVHTPHGIHTMGAHGHMSVLTTTPSTPPAATGITTIVSPMTAATTTSATGANRSTSAVAAAAAANQLPPGTHATVKFNSTSAPTAGQPIKSETAAAAAALLPQTPAPAHVQNATPNFASSQPLTILSASANARNHQPVPVPLHMNNAHQPQPQTGPVPAGNSAPPQAPPPPAAAQPEEFNHAINYVNKIKNRFSGQPNVYKQFLEILHTYQKDQKAIKEGSPPSGRFLTEAEVYAQVAKLFQNQEDLLNEFGQFLPEATNDYSSQAAAAAAATGNKKQPFNSTAGQPQAYKPYGAPVPGGNKYGPPPTSATKRGQGGAAYPPPKKAKIGVLRDVSLAEAGKYGTLNEFAFFDKVRKALKSPEVYDNFLRCLVLFNQEVISRQELVQITSTFLNKHPELFKWFKDFVGYKEGSGAGGSGIDGALPQQAQMGGAGGRDRMSGDTAMEIDYQTCKRLGASYCALPKNFVQPRCAGRTSLCREVLNDTWVSFPSWSEDSQFVTSRKTQFEEFIYRTEDERFEFDVILETNKDTIKVLECVQKKMSRMAPEEAARHRLDDCLGGSSPTIHQRAIRRIYGEKAADIIDGLKRNPVVAVPLVLRRLKAKDEEWRDVQKNFNKVWRDQNEKFYLKSLDHQGLLFKQSDVRNLRSKSLLNEIETLYDERHEQEEASTDGAAPVTGPHQTLDYHDPSILIDANGLLIHHVKRQTGIHKDDKHKIKVLLRHFVLDLFKHPRQELSDDERDDNDDEDEKEAGGADDSDKEEKDKNGGSKATRSERARKNRKEESAGSKKDEKKGGKGKDKEPSVTEADVKAEAAAAAAAAATGSKDGRRTPLHARDMESDESYAHIMCNNNWYLFFRLHQILCERLTKMYNQSLIIREEESKDRSGRKESTAVALRLKPKSEYQSFRTSNTLS